MDLEKVTIIGGGIGGLAFALALHRVGIKAEVFEQAPEIKEVGAGIVVYPNTFRLLRRLGVSEIFLSQDFYYKKAEFSTPDGEPLLSTNLIPIAEDFGDNCYPIHRAELIKAIAEPILKENIHIGHKCTKIEQNNDEVTVHFTNGKEVKTKCLVGADGIDSVVRKSQIIDDNTRYSGQTCFRGVTNFKHKTPNTLREISGKGKRFGVCPLNEERVYWWAAVNAGEGIMIPFEKRQEFLLNHFSGWKLQVEELLQSTPSEKILQNDLIDRKPIDSWSNKNVVLLGDAAHATTPNLGQGANMAIEDAIVLARCLIESSSLSKAFQSFWNQRSKHTKRIVNDSWRFGKLARWKSSFAVGLRNFFVRNTKGLAEKRLVQMVNYDAGNLPKN